MNLQIENDGNGKIGLKEGAYSKNSMSEKQTSGPRCQLSCEHDKIIA